MAHELTLETLRRIRQAGSCTRAELAKNLEISLSQVSKLTAGLSNLGLIYESGTPEPVNGRPAGRLAINPNAACVVGIDVGSDRKIAVITDLAGEIITYLDEPSPDQDISFPCLEDLINRVIHQANIPVQRVLGLGVGICTIVDPVSGMVYRYGNPDLPEFTSNAVKLPVRDELVTHLSFEHILVDDIVRTLGIAEARYGLGMGESNFVYLLADTGIGMAIMLNGVPFIGASHIAGEIAHLPVGNQPILCNCGNTGCLGVLVGFEQVLKKTRQRMVESPVRSSLRLLKNMTIEDVLKAGEIGDKIATQVLIETGEYIGQALSVILNLFGPRLVIAGGKLAQSTVCRETAGRVMRMHALEMASRGVDLKLSSLDHLAGARGAATLALDALFVPGEKDIVSILESH
jgi:predicted NBD/HSP70 family sugar kinase